MFVALSKFVIANGMTAEVKAAFKNRPCLVEDCEGFVRLDVMSPCKNPNEIWLVTYWDNEQSYQKWHRSDAHRQSHQDIPKGLKLIPQETELRFFDHICS
ncbi:antibiotic biosynthesis monooxygenase [Candidatus Albibeggiatoa sp. nov. BB20]|uniref:antibiotic biosynthesis monooxygenase family protein n=1 Tax=Candidatus Albibeggiatoa sp. nov. BB20 TaxID=3162723 RepID=UPI00336552DC